MFTLKSTQKKRIVPIDLCQHYFGVYLFFWQAMTIFIFCFLILCFNRCLSVFSLVYSFPFSPIFTPVLRYRPKQASLIQYKEKSSEQRLLETHVCDRLTGVRILMPTSDTYLKLLKRTESKRKKKRPALPSIISE